MNIIKSLLAAAVLSLVITPSSHAGVKVVGTLPNGDKIVRIKTAGVFAPSTTTVCRLTPAGDLIVLNGAGGPGFVPAVANAGGLVGAAAVLRPSRSNTNVEQSGGGASSSSGALSGSSATNVNAPVNVNNSSSSSSSTSTGGGNQNGSIHHNN